NEVEMLTIVDNETSLADTTVSEVGRDENVNLPENTVLVENIEISELESEWIEEPETTGLKYKSLNANIARERMEPMIDSLNLMKNNARSLALAINSSDDTSDRAVSYNKLELTKSLIADLQERLTSEISKSNA